MNDFNYTEMLKIKKDLTEYKLLTKEYISLSEFEGKKILKIAPEALTLIAKEAFTDVSHYLREKHLKQVGAIIKDDQSSANDKYVAVEMLKNAVISAEGVYPMCQDTGTAIIMGKKGGRVYTGCSDEKALSKGVFKAYTENNLRYSQNIPTDLYEERNSGNNLPAQIEIYSTNDDEYKFLFIAKGGGSANKSFLFQQTRAVLNPETLLNFLTEKIKAIGTSACPPYHLAVVIGGTSAEFNLKTVKLASAGYLDNIPTKSGEDSIGFRVLELEEKLLEITKNLGIGAQFGGKYFCHDVRIIRLPRHGASCPIGIGVSCSADRNIKGKITKKGIFLEKLEKNPAKYFTPVTVEENKAVKINLNVSMAELIATLSKYKVGTALSLTGKIVVARDIAHAKLMQRLNDTSELPKYFKDHIIYYAGPAKTPKGAAAGSFGPTTAGRMDAYVPIFQKCGASMVMLAKGNRSKQITESCKKYGGFYLGSIGGPAARLGKDCITKVEILEYPELGMEAVYSIDVKNFPAFIITDDKGNDFFDGLLN